MSVYQMVFLERVPDHAIIHEAVEISKKKGHKGISSFVNGVLRNAQRKGVRKTSEIQDQTERLAIETSHPVWLVKRWIRQYGEETTRAMCEANNHHLPMSVRVQPLRISRQKAMKRLTDDGFKVEESQFSPQGILIVEGQILKHELFLQGMLTVQDQSSMLVAEMMDLQQGMMILDACSAPGGKTTHIAEKIADKGQVIAYDLHEKKAKLVKKKAEQLELTAITASQADSRKLDELHDQEAFDRILLDAPCSGLGVLRGKPDIKYNKKESDIFALRKIQDELLDHVAGLVKCGGKLIYSTCTVDRHENEEAIQHFLQKHPEFEVDRQFNFDLPGVLRDSTGLSDTGLQLFPHEWDTDGFFLTRLVKNVGLN